MHCIKCKETENLTVTRTRYKKSGKTVDYICRFHNAEKKRNELSRNPIAANRATANWRKKFPDKHRAHLLARKITLESCEICAAKAVRHHPDYSRPLYIRFLCPLHHKQVHRGVLCLK